MVRELRRNDDETFKKQLEEILGNYRHRLDLLSQAVDSSIRRSQSLGITPYFDSIKPDRYLILAYGLCHYSGEFPRKSVWEKFLRWLGTKQEVYRRFLISADLNTGDTWWVNLNDGELSFCINLVPVLAGSIEKKGDSFEVAIQGFESVSTNLISDPDSSDYQPSRIDFEKLSNDQQVDIFVRGYCLLIETLFQSPFRKSFCDDLYPKISFLFSNLKTPPDVCFKILELAEDHFNKNRGLCPPEYTQSFPNLIFPAQSEQREPTT